MSPLSTSTSNWDLALLKCRIRRRPLSYRRGQALSTILRTEANGGWKAILAVYVALNVLKSVILNSMIVCPCSSGIRDWNRHTKSR